MLIQTRLEDRFSRAEVERLTVAAGRDAETWTVDDAKHTQVWVMHRADYERRVSRFLAAHLGGGAGPARGGPGLGKRAVKAARSGGHVVSQGARAAGHALARPFHRKAGA